MKHRESKSKKLEIVWKLLTKEYKTAVQAYHATGVPMHRIYQWKSIYKEEAIERYGSK